jgi:hypothetical protein
VNTDFARPGHRTSVVRSSALPLSREPERGPETRVSLLLPPVHLEACIPQPPLLEHCDAFITHAGFNSVKEALATGVPMVAVPISADQPYRAGRCAELGVARALGADARAPDNIRDAERKVLTASHCDPRRPPSRPAAATSSGRITPQGDSPAELESTTQQQI